jgi:hypothetical protein
MLCGLAMTPAKADFSSLGPGAAVSCPQWVKDRQADDVVWRGVGAWIMGFLSAYNAQHSTDVTEDLETDQLFAWVDRYCAANPLVHVNEATFALIRELEDRKNLPHQWDHLETKKTPPGPSRAGQ